MFQFQPLIFQGVSFPKKNHETPFRLQLLKMQQSYTLPKFNMEPENGFVE